MRRGLMSWSHTELPEDVLAARVARLQAAMREQGLQAVLAYTSFAQPAVVHWLTNFTPYWSEAVLAVLPEGEPVLLAALTPRVHPWIQSVSRLGGVTSAPKLGLNLAEWLQARVPAPARIGVVGLDALPEPVASALLGAYGESGLVDAAALYCRVRQPADAAEHALTRRAAAIAQAALDAVPQQTQDSASLAAAIESSTRLAGAEEVTLRVAPDLRTSATGLRLETDHALQPLHGLELSVAYKGTWVRLSRSRAGAAAAEPAAWQAARQWFDRALTRPADGLAPPPADLGTLVAWTLEASVDARPLTAIASHRSPDMAALPPGTLAVLTVQLKLADGSHWLHGAPLHIGADGGRPLGTE